MSEMRLRRWVASPLLQGWRATALRLSLAAVCAVGAGGLRLPEAEARSGASSIQVPAEIKVAPSVVTRLNIRIDLADDASPQTLLLVRGLPARVMLSEGRSFSAGVWAVPLTSVGKLEIAPATGTAGTSELSFELITLDGKVITGARSILSIEPQAASDAAKGKSILLTTGTLDGAEPPSGQAAKPAAPSLTPEAAEKARKLTERGDESMAEGKITAARLLYQAAAETGWAPAAFALAKTYDGNELARSGVVGGVRPDPALAQKWYEKARELGSAEASRRLQAMQAQR